MSRRATPSSTSRSAGQVEHVGQALAVRLDEDRERAVAAGDGEQARRPLALLPQRRPRARPAARKEQRPCRVLAEAAREQRRGRDLPDDEVLDLLGVGEQQLLDAVERGVALRQADRDAVVGPDRLDLHAEALLEARFERERPRRVDAAAERGQQAQPPVAQLVAEALDDDPPIGRQRARHLALVLEVHQQVVGRPLVEVMRLAQPGRCGSPARVAAGEVPLQLADELPERPSELDRPADGVAVPERELAGNAGRRADRDAVVADLLDPPRARAERDDLADPALVDHLLVELADPPADLPRLADHEHAVQAAVRDRAAARDRHHARVAPAFDDVRHAVPHEARLELGELVARVGAGEHAEDAFEHVAAEGLVRRGAVDRRKEVVDVPAIHDRHRHDLLGEDVERVARKRRGFDRALVHAAGHDGGLEQVAAVLREDDALARGADLVAGPADALQAARDARRALDLDDEVDRAHVDAQLQRGGRHERREAAGLELLLDLEALLAGDAPVVGADELLAGQLVEPLGEPLREPPAVREDDRAAMLPDQLEDPRVDGRPDARAGLRVGGRSAGLLVERQRLPERGHVVDGDDDLELERLSRPCVHDAHLAVRAGAAQEPGDRVERALRRAEADALGRVGVLRAEALEAFEAQREVRAALAAGDRVDLVDDDVLDVPERVAGAAGEHQVQRFGRRDEDVRRAPGDLAAILLGRVAGP